MKWIGYALLTIVFLATAFYIKAYWSTKQRLAKKYSYTLQPFNLTSDSAIVAEGKRIMETKSCKVVMAKASLVRYGWMIRCSVE